MKKITLAIAAMVAIVMMSNCGSKGSGSAHGDDTILPVERYEYTATTPITRADGSPECKVTMSIDYMTGNDEVAQRVNSAVTGILFPNDSAASVPAAAETFAKRYANDYTRTFGRYFRADADRPERWAQYEFRYDIKTETGKGRGDITTYKAHVYYYEGGAHGIKQTLTLNIDETGKNITLDDILMPGYEQKLRDKLFTALEKHANAKGLTALQEAGYLKTTDIYIPDNYVLQPDGIAFIYNTYEIAPYALGSITLTIPYDDLQDIMR